MWNTGGRKRENIISSSKSSLSCGMCGKDRVLLHNLSPIDTPISTSNYYGLSTYPQTLLLLLLIK